MATKHTPGPWKASYNNKFGQWSILDTEWHEKGDTSKFAQVLTSLNEDVDKANAILLAAAPDLLRVCKDTVKLIKKYQGAMALAQVPQRFMIDRLITVVKKAEGK